MEFHPIERAAEAFQQGIRAEEIEAITLRALGRDARVESAVELGNGSYNNTYLITLAGEQPPVILRVAPEPARQFRSERQFMRNEYASVPWLAAIADLMPRVIAADWSHAVIDRDWMVQSLLGGVPAAGPRGLDAYPRPAWTGFYRQLGTIARRIHRVRGPHFGPITGPGYATWSQALTASLETIALDAEGAGLDAADLRKAAELAADRHLLLDEITEPRMLSGDLWTVNVMLADGAPEPTITGVLDLDRTSWGDPAADWTIRMALSKPGTERDVIWTQDSYGPIDRSPAAQWRAHLYEARHLGTLRLEYFRHGDADGVQGTYDGLATALAGLGGL